MKKIDIIVTGPPTEPPPASLDELKRRVLSELNRYLGQAVSDDIKYSILSSVRDVLLQAFEYRLISVEPTDLRIGGISCVGIFTLFHGPSYLDEWIDYVWVGPADSWDSL